MLRTDTRPLSRSPPGPCRAFGKGEHRRHCRHCGDPSAPGICSWGTDNSLFAPTIIALRNTSSIAAGAMLLSPPPPPGAHPSHPGPPEAPGGLLSPGPSPARPRSPAAVSPGERGLSPGGAGRAPALRMLRKAPAGSAPSAFGTPLPLLLLLLLRAGGGRPLLRLGRLSRVP